MLLPHFLMAASWTSFVMSGHCLHHSYLGNSHESVCWATRCYSSLQGITAFCAELACKQKVCRLCSQQAFSERMDRVWAEREEKFQRIKNKQGECFGRPTVFVSPNV